MKLHVNKQSRRHQEWTILGTRHRTRDIKNKQYWAQDTEQGTSRMDNTGHKTQNEGHQEWTILSTRHRTRDIKNGQYWAQDTERRQTKRKKNNTEN